MATILEATKENKHKYDTIKSIAEKFLKMENKKKEKIKEIKEIYEVAFNNFSTSREETGIVIRDPNYSYDTDYNKMEICINTRGISFKSKYKDRTDYIDKYEGNNFIGVLKSLKGKEKEILAKITKKEKQQVFIDFLNLVNDLDSKEEIKSEIAPFDIYNSNNEKMEIKNMELKNEYLHLGTEKGGERYRFIEDLPYGTGLRLCLTRQRLAENFVIEQCFPNIEKFLLECLQQEQDTLDKYDLFIENIKEKFGKQLILKALSKKPSK